MTTLFCSFCGKNQKEVKKLIAGPAVYICDECIQLCSEIIEEETEKEAGDLANLMTPKEIKFKLDEYVIEQETAKKSWLWPSTITTSGSIRSSTNGMSRSRKAISC
jgi:hypothetical protein